MNRTNIRIPSNLISRIKTDLYRPHKFAFERAGFAFGTQNLNGTELTIFINEYIQIPDNQYIETNEVGARINAEAITSALQFAYSNNKCLFHIHLHDFTKGIPEFSFTDLSSIPKIVKSAQDFVPDKAHGMIVFSEDEANAQVLPPKSKSLLIADQITFLGTSLKFSFPRRVNRNGLILGDRYSRQSFLGQESNYLIENLKIGIIGLSGGGSHIVQQLSHIGFKNFVLSDPDYIDESNLNRVVGSKLKDVKQGKSKFDISKRVISDLHPNANINGGVNKWESLVDELKSCDLIFGCLDTLLGRRDLESFCRRYYINLIDIGMGIDSNESCSSMYGQVQASIPGQPCFKCNEFIREDNLAKEANNYGQQSPRPQVVWPNGILASSAIGIFMEMLTNWTNRDPRGYYLSFDGNKMSLSDHIRLEYMPETCIHYPISESGPVEY